MKTIEEAKRGLPENKGVLMSSFQLIAEVSFESGVKFAESWISVKDESPKMIEGEIQSEYVLVKEKDGLMAVSSYCAPLESWANLKSNFEVVEWRPINRK